MSLEVIVRDIPALADAFAQILEDAGNEARAATRPVSIAVPGGSVAEAFLPRLVRLPIDWRRVLVFFVDERLVPPDAVEANARFAREAWLDRVPIPMANIHRMRGEMRDPGEAALEYERALVAALGDPPRLDVALLGMGEDGHVASLFPGHPALDEPRHYVAAVQGAPKPPPGRLTMTLRAIAAARTVVLAAFGAAKAPILREVIEAPRSTLPAALALRSGPRAVVLLDADAASKLGALPSGSRMPPS